MAPNGCSINTYSMTLLISIKCKYFSFLIFITRTHSESKIKHFRWANSRSQKGHDLLKVMKTEPRKSIGDSATLAGGEQQFLLQITRGGLGEDRGREASKKISGYNWGHFRRDKMGTWGKGLRAGMSLSEKVYSSTKKWQANGNPGGLQLAQVFPEL